MYFDRLYKDSQFNQSPTPLGTKLLFLGYADGQSGATVIRYKDSTGFHNITSQSTQVTTDQPTPVISITQLIDNKIVIPNDRVPVAIQTNTGKLFTIDFEYITQTQTSYLLDPTPYLNYDNLASFQAPWKVYIASCCIHNGGSSSDISGDVTTIVNNVTAQLNVVKNRLDQHDTVIQQYQQRIYQLQQKIIQLQNHLKNLTQCV